MSKNIITDVCRSILNREFNNTNKLNPIYTTLYFKMIGNNISFKYIVSSKFIEDCQEYLNEQD